MKRRAVITGIGVVAPNGIGTEPYWEATRNGRSGIRRIERFDPSRYATQFAGEVPDFEPSDYIEQRLIVQTDRWTHMAMAAAQMALADAAFDPEAHSDPYTMSVITASSSGGNEFGQREIQALWGKGPIFVGAYQSIAWFYAATTGQIAIKYGMKGPCGVVASEQSGGLDTLAHARRNIRRGTEIIVSGGTEAPIGPYALTCQMTNGELSTVNDAGWSYRPFDAEASGHVPGEGGAILIVEDLDHALRRGAPRIYAEIVGHGATQDAHHHTDAATDGVQFARAMTLALQGAGVGPEDLDVVFADASGTPEGDLAETRALRLALGDQSHQVPVTAPKSMVGRLYAGGASLDVATALLAMRDGVVPPTINVSRPAAGCELNLVMAEPRRMEINTALINARGFGGFNSALVLRKYAD
jgi:3-oxoacyl-(acyl-carrier-protein) synthase